MSIQSSKMKQVPKPSSQRLAISDTSKEIEQLKTDVATLEDAIAQNGFKIKGTIDEQKAVIFVPYVKYIFWFCVAYSIVIFLILIVHGLECVPFSLDVWTANLLITSSGASVISLLVTMSKAILNSNAS